MYGAQVKICPLCCHIPQKLVHTCKSTEKNLVETESSASLVQVAALNLVLVGLAKVTYM